MAHRVLIAGAGIGGLCAALALRNVGFDVHVVEQAAQLGEVGAGLQISSNGTRALQALGLEGRVASIAVKPESMIGFDGLSGKELYRRDLRASFEARFGASYYHIHRADFHNILARELGEQSLTLNFPVVSATQHETGVTLRTADGRRMTGDLLVGADGLRSVARQSLGLADNQPDYTGMTAYRGTIPAADLPADMVPRASSNWMGPHGHVIVYYLRRYELVNVVAVTEVADWTAESWSLKVSTKDMLENFEGWHPTVRHLLGAIPNPFQWGLYSRSPQSVWGQGRLTLLGDAVHPMVPFMAQGAGMAIEDAVVLANCLAQSKGDVSGLRRYEDLRRDRTARIQIGALARGRELHETQPDRIAARNKRYADGQTAKARTFEDFDWIYSYDPIRVTGNTTS